jgi:hypothetical protein
MVNLQEQQLMEEEEVPLYGSNWFLLLLQINFHDCTWLNPIGG